ncbi:MAG: hypothetical protein RBQ97_00920 [Acholeplasma sp.]|nr:hypothetical protein [Acholeplasma sp.]
MKKDLIFVLYGSTGDLTFRKLLPAITTLYNTEKIPEKTLVLALGRRDFNTKTYLDFLKNNNENLEFNVLENITKYHKMQITDQADYSGLKEVIEEHANDTTKVIHYLAVAPDLMKDVSHYLSSEKVIEKGNINQSLIFEKPFGSNYHSAHQINEDLWTKFEEKQIYRIDHYLGKKLVKSILDLRFNNSFLSTLIAPHNVDNIKIYAKEESGILNRGGFYDTNGATRDMFQSHLLQIVALLTMANPKSTEADAIINEKVKVFKRLKFDNSNIIFGQYKGYLNEDKVAVNSLTETMLAITLFVKNKFKKVPIRVVTGKMMFDKKTYIEYVLKDQTIVRLDFAPKPRIQVTSSLLGDKIDIKHEFDNDNNEYSSLLLAAYMNQKEVFVRFDEVEQSWKFVDEVLKSKHELLIYNEKTLKNMEEL